MAQGSLYGRLELALTSCCSRGCLLLTLVRVATTWWAGMSPTAMAVALAVPPLVLLLLLVRKQRWARALAVTVQLQHVQVQGTTAGVVALPLLMAPTSAERLSCLRSSTGVRRTSGFPLWSTTIKA